MAEFLKISDKATSRQSSSIPFLANSHFRKYLIARGFFPLDHQNTNSFINLLESRELHPLHRPGIDLLVHIQITNSRIMIKCELIRDGQYFRITEQSKMAQIMEWAAEISKSMNWAASVSVHPLRSTLLTIVSQTINLRQNTKPHSIILHIAALKSSITSFIQSFLDYFLYLNGQVSYQYFLRQRNLGLLDNILTIQKELKDISELFKIRTEEESRRLIIQESQIYQFERKETKVKEVGSDGKVQKTTEESTGAGKSYVKNALLQQYVPYLNQAPCRPSDRNESLEIYSSIYLSQKDDKNPQWRQLLSTPKINLKVKECFISRSQHSPNRDGKEIKKILVLKQNKGNTEKSQHEKSIISKFKKKSSNFIAKYYSIHNSTSQDERDSIVMEFYKNSLSDYLKKHRKYISNSSIITILVGVIQALRVLKNCGIVHMDLKESNVMMERGFCPKLIDFGESVRAFDQSSHKFQNFTLPYVAPQFWDEESAKYFGFDTYSFGVMMDCVFREQFIFPMRRQALESLMNQLISGQYPSLMSLNIEKYLMMFPPYTARLLITLIVLCLHPNPDKRPNKDIIAIILQAISRWTKYQTLTD